MRLDFTFKQSDLLVKLTDIELSKGVCHAMSTEWVSAQLSNRTWNAETEYWRGVSHQRAYEMAAERDSERALRNFVKDSASRQGCGFNQSRIPNLTILPLHVGTLNPCEGMVISIFGSYLKLRDNHNIRVDFGHSVALTRNREGIYKFLDVNQGQFSWPVSTPADTVGQEMVENLHDNYSYVEVEDVYIFRVNPIISPIQTS